MVAPPELLFEDKCFFKASIGWWHGDAQFESRLSDPDAEGPNKVKKQCRLDPLSFNPMLIPQHMDQSSYWLCFYYRNSTLCTKNVTQIGTNANSSQSTKHWLAVLSIQLQNWSYETRNTVYNMHFNIFSLRQDIIQSLREKLRTWNTFMAQLISLLLHQSPLSSRMLSYLNTNYKRGCVLNWYFN